MVEAFVVFASLYGLFLRIAHPYEVSWHPHILAAYLFAESILRPMLLSFLAATMFLLLASPFFLRNLRFAGLTAWIIGAAALLFAALLCFIQ